MQDTITVLDIIQSAKANGVKLFVEQGKLGVRKEKNATIPADLMSLIRDYKAELIDFIENDLKAVSEAGISEIRQIPSASSYPLSNAQTRLYVASQVEEASVAYNMPKTITMDGLEDRESFEKAVHYTIARHEILRTVFRINNEGEIRQYVLTTEELGFTITYEDLRGKSDSQARLSAFVSADVTRPFNLAEGPLLRAALLRLDEHRYTFYYNMHHIISDGWSMDILSRDVMQCYQAFSNGQEPVLQPLAIQYKDYTAWQSKQLESDHYKQHRDYWNNQFKEPGPTLDLPAYTQRPAIKTYNGRNLGYHIPAGLISGLRSMTSEHGGSLFTGLLAVWNILLYRYTGHTDITIGNPVAGRNHIDLEDQIGFYINPLPLRHNLNPAESFAEVYKSVKASALRAYDHQVYPFDRLVEDLDLQRDNSRSALFDILIDYHGVSGGNKRFESDEVSDLGTGYIKFDIELHLTEVSGGVDILAVYNTDVYELHIIEAFLRHYRELLDSLMADTSAPVAEADLLLDEEKEQLTALNKTEKAYPDKTVIDLFAEQAVLHPDAVAVSFDGKQLTYKELEQQSGQLANCLQKEHNIAAGHFIGIHLNRSPDYIIAVLGILKAGAGYVPVDVAYPADRKQYICEDANISLVITDTSFMFEMDYYSGTIFAIDVEFDASQYETRVSLPHAPDLAYVIYTSGSTGKPKGVQIGHTSFANYIVWARDHYLTPDLDNTNFGMFTSPSFDLTITSMFLPLISGGTLKVLEENSDIYATLSQYLSGGLACIKLTPSHITMMKGMDGENIYLQIAIVGGEELKPSHVKILRSLNPFIKIYNEYGPTEATIGCAVYEVGQNEKEIYIGKPIANTRIYILNDEDRLAPFGVTGEICIGGEGLSKGYLNRADLTAEKFVKSPWGERLYKTGDTGRWLPLGQLDYQGREDTQVKVRGYRIELGEIETVLSAEPGINDVAVEARIDKQGGRQLVAYLVTSNETDIELLQQSIARKLPEYMMPRVYVVMEKLPLTPNGKIDRKALPDPEKAGSNRPGYVAPESQEEKVLVAAWETILGKDPIGIMDNFYNLGGDSLKSIQVIHKVKQAGFSMSVTDIVEHPVLQDLALKITIDEKVNIEQSEDIPAKFDLEEGKLYPVSYNQLYFINRPWDLILSHLIYIDWTSAEAFEKALRAKLATYRSFLVSFLKDDQGIQQKYLGKNRLNVDIHVENLTDFNPDKFHAQSDSYLRESYNYFDNSALIRAYVAPDSQNRDKAYFKFSIAHGITDIETYKTLVHSLEYELYAQETDRTSPSNFEFALRQEAFLQSVKGIKQREWWKRYLSNVSPKAASEQTEDKVEYVSQKITLGQDRLSDIIESVKAMNLPVSSVFLAAYQLFMHKLDLDGKSVHMVTVNGREENSEGSLPEDVSGVTTNFLPVIYNGKKIRSGEEYVRSIYKKYLDLRLHQRIPYEVIRQDYREATRYDLSTVINGFFNFRTVENILLNHEDDRKGAAQSIELLNRTDVYGVVIICDLYKDGLKVNLLCPKSIYDTMLDRNLVSFYINNCLNDLFETTLNN
ncbi:amino acid adenylation domain-containing protein [Roseivirga sp. BDSF3-8]|uniref:amino acid adenylation domain-containing protein n=1 Tax=Roseivirga sp. BDSF3-8 TaxID=3241598 RepID=UPI0035325B37